ncbi:MAG: winged helix-turn-helix transcriptional regulator [Candidatus Thermoplasmatota archaeon]|nr:winged helix-turn-helix transcriptional regulator [Candidatus Thermoplasmatota archaeon]
MDERDRQIIDILNRNSRTSNSEIARVLGISEGTVRQRIQKLLDNGIIKKFTILFGREVFTSLILIKVIPEMSQDILEILKSNYDEIYEVSGSFDYSVRIIAHELNVINRAADFIRSIDGVIETDTLIRLV